MGPWHHGQEIEDASALGAIKFNSDTGLYFRQEILRPFLAQYLKDDAPKADIAPVTAFETGTNTWERLHSVAARVRLQREWLRRSDARRRCICMPDLELSFDAPKGGEAAFDEYVSDPAKPVPFRARPIQPVGYPEDMTWAQWLVDDQREQSGRADVLAFESEMLTTPVKISGQPIANLVASTSGTDSDWVVKLIDVYPDEVAGQPSMGGYQLMVSADIFRGRYRESLETAKAIAAEQAAALPVRAAEREPRVSAGTPDHGAGPVELVPAV